jgi:hypothetical protein
MDRPGSWEEAVTDYLGTLHTTLVSKQRDYGHENILWGGQFGVLLRAHDKVARIKNLLDKIRPSNEPLVDSWLDLAGYAIIGAMLEAGTFERPLAEDMGDESVSGTTESTSGASSPTALQRTDNSEPHPYDIVHDFRSDLPG